MPVQVASHVLHGHPREVPEVPPRLRGEAVHQRHFEVDGVVRIGPVGLGRCTPETALPSLMAVKLQEGWGEYGLPSSRDCDLRGVDEHASPRWRVTP